MTNIQKDNKNTQIYKKYYKKIGDLSQGWPEGSLFNSYHTEV